MSETKARYPGAQWETGTGDAYLDDWSEMWREFGQDRFEQALKAARNNSNFFPVPAEIRKYIPAPQCKMQIVTKENCEMCDGFGWKNIGPAMPTRNNPNPKADRYDKCDCRTVEFV
jgi:hypothetical protein